MKRTKADLEQYLAAAERKVLALQGELEQSRSIHRILQQELARKESIRLALESLLIKERAREWARAIKG